MHYDILSVESDAKTIKGIEYNVLTGIFYGAPHTIASPKTMCPFASESCKLDCLFNSGLSQILPHINASRIRKTKLLLNNPTEFYRLLDQDIARLIRDGERRNMQVAVRLNGTTDRLFERDPQARAIMEKFKTVQFYDYTKIPIKFRTNLPSNYHLTFSLSESNREYALDAIARGVNVAVVFKTPLFPTTFWGRPVLDGDISDLRFMDAQAPVKDGLGMIIALKLKGNAQKKRKTNFAN